MNAILLKIILDRFYADLSKSNQVKQPQFKNVNYFIGTPGLGKSASFFALKYLHDIKTKAAIKVGIPRDSIFNTHYKLLYVNSTIRS